MGNNFGSVSVDRLVGLRDLINPEIRRMLHEY